MTARRVQEGKRFLWSLSRARVRVGSPQMAALRAMVDAMAAADLLPGFLDYVALMPPVERAWIRRVPGHNLWLFYRVGEDRTLYLLTVVGSPPVPILE